jgi:hypothetical protein
MKNVIVAIQIILLLLSVNFINAQPYYTIRKYDALNNFTSSQLFQYSLGSFNNMALLYNGAPYIPSATFQIKGDINASHPLFQVDGISGSNLGSIKLWKFDGTTYYGIYESSIAGLPGRNYFQDPVIFGLPTSSMFIDATTPNETRFTSSTYANQFKFMLDPGTPSTNNLPLTISSNGIVVHDTTVTDEFRLTTNPGLNKVLVSDNSGYGTWQNILVSDNTKWLFNKDSDIYSNPSRHHVGIGFQNSSQRIYQMLQILNGNILLTHNTSTIEAPTSKNGSILFGDSVSASNTLGEWGIEYETNDTATYATKGLNFWKPYSSRNGGDHYLYLRNDGNIGIGTANTFGYKLGVAGSIICTELKVRKLADWPDYVLKDDYILTPLCEVEAYINKNQHLADMPSAKEVSENGINIGDMDVTLVKKIEELTKYIIDQQKQIDELKQKIENR